MQNEDYRNAFNAKATLRNEYDTKFGKPTTEKERAKRLAYINNNLELRIQTAKYLKSDEHKELRKVEINKESMNKYRSLSIIERKRKLIESRITKINKELSK